MAEDEMDTSVRVAVRIRPQIPRELIDMCRMCTTVTPNEPQIILGADKAFTFDFVFDTFIQQAEIYNSAVDRLVEGSLKGYNATVLAYGQTGSGKTYTMGTGFETDVHENFEGIIPRAVRHIFAGIERLQQNPYDGNGECLGNIQFSVAAQFMELYNEDIIDLLDPYNKSKVYKIHEDLAGGIAVTGATIKPLNGPTDAMRCLQQGALARTTASTQMNAQSSRSHALFTILIRRQRVISCEESGMPEDDLETLTSKFHFVDLAGSERLKRTGATGERAREGISINCGLLSLGNVISALGDKSKKASHIPYRDSKLTRLLQDSLGGNSQTLMIACISPSDRDFMETLNTLKYANRARNIKNRVQINQDQSSRTISSLRREIAALQLELLEYKQGKRCVDAEGNTSITDAFQESAMLLADNKRMQQRIKAMQETINNLTERNVGLLTNKAVQDWSEAGSDKSVTDLISGYLQEIEKLQARLIESDQMYQQLKKSINSPRNPAFIKAGRSGEMQAELNDLSSDIELKTKLIEQLELSQNRLKIMKQHYEEKLNVLNSKIQNTQQERDQVLANMSMEAGVGGITNSLYDKSDKIKKVRDEYERKISDMQKELRKLQSAQKEHVRQQRELQSQDSQLRTLKNDLFEMKSAKIKLMRKMTEENNRHREEDGRKNKEISKLRKEARKQLNTIKSLEAQQAAKDQILKRRSEQVNALKKDKTKHLSVKAAGRLPNKKNASQAFSARQARIKWESVLRTINRAARSKQAVIELERELERLIAEREDLSRELANVQRRQKIQPTLDLASEEDTLSANLNYIQENITQVQHSIMELEDGKETVNESQALNSMIEDVQTVEEAKFLIEKLSNSAILQTCDIALTNSRLSEREAILNEVQQESQIQQQLLQHVLSNNPSVNISDTFLPHSQYLTSNIAYLQPNNTGIERISEHGNKILPSSPSSRSTSPHPDDSSLKTPKVRRRTALPQDLLFGDVSDKNEMTRSFNQPENSRSFIPLARVPSAPGSLKGLLPMPVNRQTSSKKSASPIFSRKTFDTVTAPVSPRIARKQFLNKASPILDEDVTRTPLALRRLLSREDTDVFSRLGAGQTDPTPGGVIRVTNEKAKLGVPLVCTHVVEGHSSSVLSLLVNDNILYTGSVDRSVKIWDMQHESRPSSLISHPGPIVSLAHDRKTNLLFTACGAFVRVWDNRAGYTKPVKILCSSGSVYTGVSNPGLLQNGESPITALCIGASGNLFSSASDKVRIWDLNSFNCLGKLSGGHQAAVMCVTSWKGENNTDFVATGSKDHYVKVFEVPSNGGLVMPLLHLEPPHYDGVQSLAVTNNALGADAALFSGSRDSGIKRWDLRNGELKQSLNNAHKGWVSGMTISENILLTSCRGGYLRLWNVESCDSLAEIKTDSPINNIVSDRSLIYTAANSGEVRIWRFTNSRGFVS
ncbi:kinesin-like protein KIF21B isoform X3 [Bradysia coprophila]|uniref:kinesin-like protein KIF21B isoform X3 n=1 Tax=Bradysia coprophila TaxID=38358 RepID=UPI00187D6E72|nr:kinesin-like protein KIF21B isoform X3 [Bradysia coprophila]